MRVNTNTGITHTGTMEGEVRRLSLDENSLVHLMGVLTDLYTDSALATIREYSTNARDSHQAAGVDEPVRVYLPSTFDPTYVVRDQGVGMSAEDITEHYSKYGWSSKRDNDDETGMLGLGCKAALTYTSQFTVVGTKDGYQTIALVGRDDDGAGSITILSEEKVDEPNGVEIRVPVSNSRLFNERAQEFFSFWRSPVLVNDAPPKPPEGTWVDPDVLQRERDTAMRFLDSKVVVVMGDIPYPVDISALDDEEEHLFQCLGGGWYRTDTQVVAWVPMGSVNFVTSREELQYTKLTKNTLNSLGQWLSTNLFQRMQEELDAQTNVKDALEKYLSFRRQGLSMSKLPRRWHGVDLAPVSHGHQVAPRDFVGFRIDVPRNAATGGVRRKADDLSPDALGSDKTVKAPVTKSVLWVRGFHNKACPPGTRWKALKAHDDYVGDGDPFDAIMLVPKVPIHTLVNTDHVLDWEDDVKPFKAPRRTVTGKPSRPEANYCLYSPYEHWVTANEMEEVYKEYGEKLLYGTPQEDIPPVIRTLVSQHGYRLVLLGRNRWAKLCRLFPSVRHVHEALHEDAKKLFNSLSEDVRKAIAYQEVGVTSTYLALEFTAKYPEILDPELREACATLQAAKPRNQGNVIPRETRELFTRLPMSAALKDDPHFKEAKAKREKLERVETTLMDKYPMMGAYRFSRELDSLLDYVNALYLYKHKDSEETTEQEAVA